MLGAILGGIGSLAGGILGGSSASKNARKAAEAQLKAQKLGIAAQKEMYGNAENALAPYTSLGAANTGNLQAATEAYGGAGEYVDRLNALTTPSLRSEVSLDLENDPIYQLQKQDMLKTLNRRYAGSGRAYSSDADNAILNNQLALMQDAYGRSEDELVRANENALTTYGLDASKLSNLYSMQNALDLNNIGNYYNLAGMGSNAAGNLASVASGTGANLATTYGNTGNALSNIYSDYGATQAQNYNDTIAGILGSYNNYELNNLLRDIYGTG